MSEEDARSVCERILRELKSDSVRTACGTVIWHSGIHRIEKEPDCGFITHIAEAALFCAVILSEPSLSSLHEDAARIAEPCLEQLQIYAERLEGERPEYLRSVLPLGLESGVGLILLAVRAAVRAGIAGAEELAERYLQIICRNHMYQDKRRAGGEAGLILAAEALSGSAQSGDTVTQLMTSCADAILEQAPSELPMTEAMRGAALSKAFCRIGNERYKQGAYEAFQHVQDAYAEYQSESAGVSGTEELASLCKEKITVIAETAKEAYSVLSAFCVAKDTDNPDMPIDFLEWAEKLNMVYVDEAIEPPLPNAYALWKGRFNHYQFLL